MIKVLDSKMKNQLRRRCLFDDESRDLYRERKEKAMKKILKKIFNMLVASVIIFFVAIIISLILILIQHFCPTLYWVIAIIVLLVAGYLFGNVFK